MIASGWGQKRPPNFFASFRVVLTFCYNVSTKNSRAVFLTDWPPLESCLRPFKCDSKDLNHMVDI